MSNGPYTVPRTCNRDCPRAWECLLINDREENCELSWQQTQKTTGLVFNRF